MYQHSVSAEPGSAPMASPDVASEARADEALASQAGEPVATQTPAPAEAADVHDPSHPFRDELARAMQAAAQRERLRIEGRIDDDANSHVGKVRVRASVEADELKRLAEDDVSRIRAWCKVEVERVRAEADIQVGERRDRLEEHLGQHASIIDGEIDRVSEAVESYRHELEVFFVSLGAVKDPSEIARLADAVPGPPDFELIRAIARADAVGRLSDLEAVSASEVTTSAEAGTDDDEAPPVQAATEHELVAVMDPAFAQAVQVMPVEATQALQTMPVETTQAVQVMPVEATQAVQTMPVVEAMPSPEPELVAVMDPVLAPTAEATGATGTVAVAETVPVAEAAPAVASAIAEVRPASTATEPELVGVMDPALAEKAEAEAIADAAAAETADPELVAAGVAASEPNAATRFLRSLTAWGSSDHGNNGHK
jgi:hypothetical protein